MNHPLKAKSAEQLPAEIMTLLTDSHSRGEPITLVTGVFDILHQEHENFLIKAKELGGILLVGIESDVRVTKIKGEGRPINGEAQRLEKLSSNGLADAVFILPEAFTKPDHYRALIQMIKPKYLAVSSHTAHLDVKRALLAEFGGEVVIVHQHNPSISTTQILAQKTV